MTNPFRFPEEQAQLPEPAILIIFGVTGDLARRKLMPALYNLARENLLPARFAVVGFARSDWNDGKLRAEMRRAVEAFSRTPLLGPVWEEFAQHLYYFRSHYDDAEGFRRLDECLQELDARYNIPGNRLHYVATPPVVFQQIIRHIGLVGLNRPRTPGSWVRVVIEKPFGTDLASARQLNASVGQVFSEDQVFRIDHYLGKETVQNLLAFRFANSIYEPLWNQKYIDHVQITVAESVGIETRAGFYDQTGALRDMVQNHMMQLLSLMAMEPPVALEANAVRDEKVKVLRAIKRLAPADVSKAVVRGQYGPGAIHGQPVPGYRQEPGVHPNSTTETYVAMKLEIDNWRWAGVPFYLRTGKRLPKKISEIAVYFRTPPQLLFERGEFDHAFTTNVLSIQIQPNEGISLTFNAKVPGSEMRIRPVVMDFRYGSSFGLSTPEAYERLLLDAWQGDATLFIRADEVEESWRLLTPVLETWQRMPPPDFPNYPAGTWGPSDADVLLALDGRRWRRL